LADGFKFPGTINAPYTNVPRAITVHPDRTPPSHTSPILNHDMVLGDLSDAGSMRGRA